MPTNTYYNAILTEHNLRPEHKHGLEAPTCALHGINPSCGDDITLHLQIDEDGTILDGSFVGTGCAISQASADMMLDLVIGKKREEALALAQRFMRMIKGEASEEDLEALEESSALQDIAHMPRRVKCDVLGWRTLTEALSK